MFYLIDLHNFAIVIILRVLLLISYIISYSFFSSYYYKGFSEGTIIETIWSMVPAVLLVFLVIPSIKSLYLIEDRQEGPIFTFKIVAHQWY